MQRGPRVEAIRESQARLRASEVLTRNAKADLARAQNIFDLGLSNQSDLDGAQTRFDASTSSEQAARESLASLLSGTTVEELLQAQAALDAAEASLRLSQIDLQRLQLHAPMDGVVDKILFEIGERPQPGTTIAVLLDGSRSYARIYVPEHRKAQMIPGACLEIRLDGGDSTFQVVVRWTSSDASFTPYFALTEHDRSRLSFLAELDIEGAQALPVGLPLEAWFPANSAD